MVEQFSLEEFYDAYPRVEEDFQAALDVSLSPRGPEMLYDLVGELGLPARAVVVDVGCGEGKQALELARRFDVRVTGLDPLPRHIELANEALTASSAVSPELKGRVRFGIGTAENMPVDDASVDLVWCKDVLVHVGDLDAAYQGFRRVLRDDCRVIVYASTLDIASLGAGEAVWRWRAPGGVPANADPGRMAAAIVAAGFEVDVCIDVGIEWREWSEEHTGNEGRQLLHAARLLRDPERYVAQFGQAAYDIMLGDCMWHVYHMIGLLGARVYVLSRSYT
jgi:SAM-dependent methyltransferase